MKTAHDIEHVLRQGCKCMGHCREQANKEKRKQHSEPGDSELKPVVDTSTANLPQ